jgi:tetratricopeptide (TPR) repeat protein
MSEETKKQPTEEGRKQAEEYFNRGNEAYKREEYHKALILYGKTFEIIKTTGVLYNMGLTYSRLEKYDEAILCYDEALKLSPNSAVVWYSKGYAYYKDRKYNEAIKCFDKAISIDPNYLKAWGNKGNIYSYLGLYKEAIECYDKVIEIDNKDNKAWYNKGLTLLDLLNQSNNQDKAIYEEIGICFLKGQKDIIDILVRLNNNSNYIYKDTIAKAMLDGDRHFKNTVGKTSGAKLEAYKDIYVRSLQIVAMLHVDLNKYEKHVAHYTRRGVAEMFLAAQSNFRLNTVTTANDPSEGKVLLDFFGIEEDDTSSYQAFVGSFIFNPDCLNQFRLYGKEDGREATGVSITVNAGFFNEGASINKGLQIPDVILEKEEDKKEQAKESLYRCIYIDPQTSRVVSLGHKENYVFYREDTDVKDKTIDDYRKYKNKIKKEVEASLAELKDEITKLLKSQRTKRDKKRAQQIISGLLIHLRYLVKHVAFREEQECRIIKVEKVDSKNKNVHIDTGNSRMYCETIKLRDEKECYITDIHFGPKASGKELFEDILKRLDLKKSVSLHQSDHPFFS